MTHKTTMRTKYYRLYAFSIIKSLYSEFENFLIAVWSVINSKIKLCSIALPYIVPRFVI